jgi:hypothetical protein
MGKHREQYNDEVSQFNFKSLQDYLHNCLLSLSLPSTRAKDGHMPDIVLFPGTNGVEAWPDTVAQLL